MRNCRLYNNSVSASTARNIWAEGGAIYLYGMKTADIVSTNITYNRVIVLTSLGTATSTYIASGGGIVANSPWRSLTTTLRINSSIIAYNRVDALGPATQGKANATGGGVYLDSGTLVVKSSRFYGNAVSSNHMASGGAIGSILGGTGNVTLWGCLVFSNSITGQYLSVDAYRVSHGVRLKRDSMSTQYEDRHGICVDYALDQAVCVSVWLIV